jgi:PAS domain S-box-containing protein
MKDSEQQYRNIVDSAFVGVYKTNLNGDIIYVNKALAKMFEYDSPEEMLAGGGVKIYMNPTDSKKLIENLKEKDLVDKFEIEILTKAGNTKNVLLIAILDRNVLYGIIVDIAECKKTDEALRKANNALEIRVKERTEELVESNAALKVLLKQRENDKREHQENILANVKHLILPYIEKLKKNNLISNELDYLNIIESNLKEIISPFSLELSSQYLGFTPKEIHIAGLIKDGKQDKDMVEILNISLDTIKTHRRNIRRKLDIYNKKINLKSYLLSLYK